MRRGKIYTYSIAAGLLVLLFLPMLQELFHFFRFPELKGNFKQYERPRLSAASWFSGHFQDTLDLYTERNFGFSNPVIRLHNQYLFSCFRLSRSPSLVIGRENHIYDYQQIRSSYGQDFLGEDSIRRKVEMLKDIQTSLHAYGIELLVVIAPSKPSCMPEYIPSRYRFSQAPVNEDAYNRMLQEQQIPVLNFSPVFKEWVHSKPYPVFPKCGVHWSNYGACLAADSAWKWICMQSPGPLASISWDTLTVSNQLSASDYDLGGMLNLVWPVDPGLMAYPKMNTAVMEGTEYPRMLTIADSFFWLWFTEAGFDNRVCSNSRFWEYYQTQHTVNDASVPVTQLPVASEVLHSDIILLLCSEANLYRMGFGFVEDIHARLPEIHQLYRQQIHAYRDNIGKSEAYMQLIEQKARQKQISVDSMLTLDAIYLFEHEN